METAESLDALRGDIRRVESSLSTEIDELRTQMVEGMDQLRTEIAAVKNEFRAEIGELRTQTSAEFDELRREMRDSAAAGRRHNEVLFESLRDDIRLVAEGVAVLGERVDRLTR